MHRHKGHLLVLIIAIVGLIACEKKVEGIELPYYEPDEQVVHHPGYSLLYNEDHEQADWVAYELTASEVEGSLDRTDHFEEDWQIFTGSATPDDYKGSGYDRGHLLPAADAAWSEEAMEASFYMSNMSPQHPGFNRGGWRMLEEQVRVWAEDNERLYVVTGPVLEEDGAGRIGPNKVTVPQYYFKVVLDYLAPEKKAIGFIMPNEKLTNSLSDYAVSVDSVEAVTGFDFYHSLPDRVEEELESELSISSWELEAGDEESKLVDDRDEEVAARCLGATQSGSRCKRTTTNESQYCWQHQEQEK